MNKKRFMNLLLCIIVVIVAVFVLDFAIGKIKIANTLKKGEGTLVRDYNEFFLAEDVTKLYVSYIKENNEKMLKAINENGYSKNEYAKLSEELNAEVLYVEMKYLYKLTENTYRCEFELLGDDIMLGEENGTGEIKPKKEIKDNSIVIELNKEETTFRVINAKFNI